MHLSSFPVIHDAFRTIETHQKAYLIGFLLADGGIRTPTKHSRFRIDFRIKSEDIRACVMLQEVAGGHLRIIEKGYRAQWEVTSDRMASDLIALGITPRKSLTASLIWDAIPRHLHGSVLAGLIDGDGHLRVDPKYRRLEISVVTASVQLRDQLLNRFPFFKSTVTPSDLSRKNALYKVLVESNREQLTALIREVYEPLPFKILDRKQVVLDRICDLLADQRAYGERMAKIPAMKESGMTVNQIARQVGTSVRPVFTRLRREGIVSKRTVFTEQDKEEIRRLFEQGCTPRQIHAAIKKGTEQAVRFHLDQMGCRKKVPRERQRHENTDEILDLYRIGQPAYRIAETLRMDVGVVRRTLRDEGIELRRGSGIKLTPSLVCWADEELRRGRTLRSVAEELGVSATLIRLRRRQLLESVSTREGLLSTEPGIGTASTQRG